MIVLQQALWIATVALMLGVLVGVLTRKGNRMPRLENWKFVSVDDHDGKQAECLAGNVYDDTRYNRDTGEFKNGHRVVTSEVRLMSPDRRWAVTRTGTKYLLGEPGEPKVPED
jgi:hypothetical protein